MGMRSGKALKVKRTAARKPAAKKKSTTKQVAAAKPKVVTRTVTVTVDRNDALRALAQRIVDATVANDEAAMLALYAPNVESREAANPPSTGIAALREKFAMWRNMVSDSAFLPRSICADGKTIVIEWDGRVTLAASGRVAEMNEVAIHEIEHGRIVRERFYYDPAILQP
jgi:ketosteroid isomerase-like protein